MTTAFNVARRWSSNEANKNIRGYEPPPARGRRVDGFRQTMIDQTKSPVSRPGFDCCDGTITVYGALSASSPRRLLQYRFRPWRRGADSWRARFRFPSRLLHVITGRPSSSRSHLLRRHDVEPEILVQIDEIADELGELGLITGKLDLPGLDRILERQLPGQDLGQIGTVHRYGDIGLGSRCNRASD